MRGLGWTAESTIEQLAGRYRHALQSYYLPFVRAHEHFFENCLLNYMFRTLFPYGRRQPDTKISIDRSGEWMKDSYLLLATHYAILRTLLIGMAALHGDSLNIKHALKLAQSCSKAFQHSNSFSSVILQFLKQNRQDSVPGVVSLVTD
jgi:lysine-N-methylase